MAVLVSLPNPKFSEECASCLGPAVARVQLRNFYFNLCIGCANTLRDQLTVKHRRKLRAEKEKK